MRVVLRWTVRILLGLVALVVVALIGVVIWLNTESAQRLLREKIVSIANAQLASGALEIGDLHVSLRRIEAKQIVVTAANEHPVLSVEEISIGIAPWSLLHKQIEIPSLSLTRPEIHLVHDGDHWNLPELVPSPEPSEPKPPSDTLLPAGWSLSVPRIAIDRAHLTIDDPALELEEIDIAGGVRVHDDTVELDSISIVDGPDGSRIDANGKVAGVKNLDVLEVDLAASAIVAPALSARLAAIAGKTMPEHPVTSIALAANGDQRGLHLEVHAGPDGAGDAVTLVADAVPAERPIPLHGAVRIADLSIVSAYGGPAAAGAAELTFQGAADPEGEARVEATLDGKALAYADQATLESLTIPAKVSWSKSDGVEAAGTVDLSSLGAAGWTVQRTSGEWHVHMPAGGPPVVKADLTIDDTRNGARRISTVRANARASLGEQKDIAGEVEVRGAALGTGHPISGRASIDVQDNHGTFAVDFREEKKGPRELVANGTLDLEQKSVVVPELSFRPAPDITWRATEPLRARLADGGVEDVHVALDSDMGSIRANVSRADKARIIGQVRVRDLDLARLREIVVVALGPEKVPTMSGTVDAGIDSDMDGDSGGIQIGFAADKVTAADAVSEVSLALKASITPDRVTANATASQKNDVLANVSLDVPIELRDMSPRIVCDRGPLEVALRIPQVSFERIREALPALPVQKQELHVGGRIAMRGDPCSPVPDMDAIVSIKTGGRDIRVRVQTPESEDANRVRATIDGTLDGQAMVHVSADAALAHRATMTALIHGAEPPDLGKVSSWLHDWKVDVTSDRVPLDIAGLQDIEGVLLGRFHVAGNGSEIEDLDGDISIADGKVANVVVDRARVAVLREGEDIRTDIDFGFGGEGALLAHASANKKALFADPTTAPFRLEVEKGTVPIAFIGGILHPTLTKGDGTLTIEGSVAGTAKDPQGDLTIRVKNGSIDVPASGVNYSEIDLLAKLEGTVLTVDHADVSSSSRWVMKKIFAGKDEGHTAHLSGSIDLAGGALGQAKLKLQLREFWVASITEMLLSASGDLTVDGAWPALTVNGSVAVDEGRLKLDKHRFLPKASTQPHADIVFTEPRAQFAEPTEDEKAQGPSLLDELDVNMRIDLRRRLTFQATMPLSTDPGSPADLAEAKASGRLDGSLKVGVHQGDISIGGSIETVEATANLLGAQFEVKQGTIAFASADYKEPNLDFELVRDVGTYGTVTALVSGTPSALSIDSITSDQYSDQADVLSLLLFGKPQSEMGSGSDNNVALEAAMALVGGQVARGIGGGAVTASYDATSGLSAGVSLSRDLFLAFLYNPTSDVDENRTGVKLSYFIGNRTQADLATGDAGDSSAWLYWKLRF